MSQNRKIIIVGAGASGIAAATKLLENGFENVIILEAENRIGGRICSVEFGGTMVDVGGQWVHGEKGNVVFEKVKDLDLLSTSLNKFDDNTYYLSDGSLADKRVTDHLFSIGVKIIDDKEGAKSNPGPFGDYFIKRFYEDVLKEFGNDRNVAELAILLQSWFEKFFFCLSSGSWYNISTLGAHIHESCEGDQQLNWRDKGYRTILDVLMKKIPYASKPLPLDDKIYVNKEVSKIVWKNDDIRANNGTVTVSCSDGSSYEADHVIFTASLGVLKNYHESIFVPQLPPYKINSIEGINLGTVNKILLKFPNKWWPNNLKGFSLLWVKEDRINLVNEFDHFEPSDEGKSWLEHIFGFYVVDSNPKVLLAFVVGEVAKKVELLPDDVVIQGCMYLLRKFAGWKYEIPQADGVLRSKWKSNPHFCGSYTHVSIEAEKRKATAEDLAKPLVNARGKEVVLFAGESTNATKFSTVHGAIETGYREAERLIKFYKKPDQYKIIIVGAGMAGLGAALKLTELGCRDFIVLEAQETVGGRIKTITIDGRPLDLGAQWLHGKDNPLYLLAKKNDLLSEEMSEEGLGMFVRNDGVVFDEFLVKRVDFEVGKILEECQTFVNKTDYPTSVGDFMEQRFRKYLDSCDDSEELKQMKLELFDWHMRFQVVDNSCHNMKRLSAKYWGSYVCLDDVAHYNLKYGYNSLVDVIVDSLPKERIRLKTEVIDISYDKTKVTLQCNDNQVFYCDHLILTASIGVLKEFYNIQPPLPDSLKSAIDNMGFYGIGKIYLFFDNAWWGQSKGFQFIWKANAVFQSGEEWTKHLTGFDEVFNQPNVLIGWVGSDGVREMESLSEEDVGFACMKVLRRFLPKWDVPPPTTVIRTKWFSNPWIKGSYCHITPECDDSSSGIDSLSDPVYLEGVPRIILAGEAVHPSHYSTTHGAFESGQQQANVIHEYILEQGQTN